MGVPVAPRTYVAHWDPSVNGANTGLNGRGRKRTLRGKWGGLKLVSAAWAGESRPLLGSVEGGDDKMVEVGLPEKGVVKEGVR